MIPTQKAYAKIFGRLERRKIRKLLLDFSSPRGTWIVLVLERSRPFLVSEKVKNQLACEQKKISEKVERKGRLYCSGIADGLQV